MLDFRRFQALTFDCYGTLIDWEAGLLEALSSALSGSYDPDDLLRRFATHETRFEAGPYVTYQDVLARTLRAIAQELQEEPSSAQVAAFAQSVKQWRPFADSPAALARLGARFRLGVITNCDDDLFAASNAKLGVAFDWVITAQQIQSYKPSDANFLAAFERLGIARERILHVAQSLFHDHVPAKRLGLRTVWIDRRAGRQGSGATPLAGAVPDAVFPDLASFAAAALA
jgi:2-haloacid dehalogenase